MPSTCMSPPYIQLSWMCPLMMMPLRRQIAMMIFLYTPSSRLPTSSHATTWQHACTFWPSRTTDDWTVYTVQGPHVDGVLARNQHGTPTSNARCVNRQSTSLSSSLMMVALGHIVSHWTNIIQTQMITPPTTHGFSLNPPKLSQLVPDNL